MCNRIGGSMCGIEFCKDKNGKRIELELEFSGDIFHKELIEFDEIMLLLYSC